MHFHRDFLIQYLHIKVSHFLRKEKKGSIRETKDTVKFVNIYTRITPNKQRTFFYKS